jgi:hypothetical protein
VIQAGSSIAAGDIIALGTIGVIKGADEPLASSTTLQDDDDLYIAVPANTSLLWVCKLSITGGSRGSSDFKWFWSVPDGMTGTYWATYEGTGGGQNTGQIRDFTTVNAVGTAGTSNPQPLEIMGSLTNGETAGTLQLQWAQNTSSSTDTTVKAGSLLTAWQPGAAQIA